MVDPDRKINRLSDDDAAFLRECELEFRNRYTVDDEEFAEFMKKPSKPSPIVEPWKQRNYGDSRGNWNNRNNYRPNNRNNYHRNNDHQRQNYRQHYSRPHDRNYRRDGDNSGHGHHSYHGHHSHHSNQGHGHGHGSSHPY
ncbi:RNA guanine-N7 methyltransferase activating subunit-like [Contarinia nasturtii]|uniref:RNA guanine-N7 methyltransferase activating subunit-like n=1 Tax=Contarinia nasturtii TaxID=265458 RepID=UPI0012D45ACF|nr:RNA guanine-N7 methyltransferase activating subunit-like [Contarinia nasturtii]